MYIYILIILKYIIISVMWRSILIQFRFSPKRIRFPKICEQSFYTFYVFLNIFRAISALKYMQVAIMIDCIFSILQSVFLSARMKRIRKLISRIIAIVTYNAQYKSKLESSWNCVLFHRSMFALTFTHLHVDYYCKN